MFGRFGRFGFSSAAILIVCLVAAVPAQADHGRPRIGFGVTIGAPWAWHYPPPSYYYYPPPVYAYPPRYYYYDYPPPVVVPSNPPTYIERADPPRLESSESAYWYYCRSPEGYYPYVKECSRAWERVAPQPPSTAPRR